MVAKLLELRASPSSFRLEEIAYTPPAPTPRVEPRGPYEVRPEDWAAPESYAENRWPNGQVKPHGRKMKCDAGIDFAQTCPVRWSYVARGPQGPECKAPPDFYTETPWCRQQLTARQAIPASIDERKKKELYDACWLMWPCRTVQHDYRRPCPQGWTWQSDGSCAAPYFYRGTCPFNVNVLNYTKGMKATFAANCGVGWPLDQKYEAKPPVLPAKYPSHAPGQKPAWECKRNYLNTCPGGFNFDGQLCHEDGTYSGAKMTNCAHFDARRWTDEMKEAFAAHCHVWWPCVQGQSAVKGLPNGAVLQAKLCLVPAREVACGARGAHFL